MPVDVSTLWQKINVGADWETTIRMYLDENKTPQDTTGWAMEVKVKKLDGTVLKTLTVGAGIVNTPAQGKFVITYAAADTATITVQQVKVTVKVTDAGAGIDYLAEGIVDVYFP